MAIYLLIISTWLQGVHIKQNSVEKQAVSDLALLHAEG